MFALAVAPHTRGGLFIGGRVPVGVEEDQAVGADEVEPAAAGLAAEQEHEAGDLVLAVCLHLQCGRVVRAPYPIYMCDTCEPQGIVAIYCSGYTATRAENF